LYGSKDEIISYLRSSNLEFDENENIISVKISSLGSIKHLNNLKSNLDSYELLKGSMDDVFINITGRNLE
jgi:multidrug/hemolysin transport system ATP-binding protein